MRYYNHSLNEYDNYVFNFICFDLRKKGKCRHDTPNKSYNWKVLFSIFLTKSYLEDYRTSNGKEIGYIRYMYKEDVRKVKHENDLRKDFPKVLYIFAQGTTFDI